MNLVTLVLVLVFVLEPPLLVTIVLLVPALVLGVLFGIAVRHFPGIDPASARPAGAVARQLEGKQGSRLARSLNPRTETGLLLTLGLVVLVVGGVVLGALGLLVRSNSSLLRIDRSVTPWGRQQVTPFAQWMLDFVTSFGSTGVLVAATLAIAVFEIIRRPNQWLPVFLLAVAVGQTLMSSQVKNLLLRVRPTVNPIAHTLGPSFPSGHTTGAAACFAAFALVLGRGRSRNTQAVLAGVAVFVAVAVGASRVLLGVHWLTDVIGGIALGWAWFALCSIAFGGRLLRLGAPVEAAARAAALDRRDTSTLPP